MDILALNCGSSSVKYQLFDWKRREVIAKGMVERVTVGDSFIVHEVPGRETYREEYECPSHETAIHLIIKILADAEHGVVKEIDEISAVGHRVVHGGEKFTRSVMIDEDVLAGIKEVQHLAPLHNPPNIAGIEAARSVLPDVPHVAIFDTAFHQTMPEHAYTYPLPHEWYTKYGVRRYGFHGTSHAYVSHRAAEILQKPFNELKLVTCHLGNGSSITAVDCGKSVDTSLGFGTVPGVLMGTRSGEVDPTLVLYLMDKENLDTKLMSHILHKESGILGISGISSDLRDVEEAAEQGNQRAKLALDMLCYGVRKHIGAYAAAMGGIDAIVFTAGIGENSSTVRKMVVEGLEFLGADVDPEKNNVRGKERIISTDGAKVSVVVVPTNEELVIARDTKELIKV